MAKNLDKNPAPAPLLRNARLRLGMTQAEMARTLRVSIRAVQSYEQGWRVPPPALTSQLLTLLAVSTGVARKARPCWEQTNCPAVVRDKCPAYRVTHGSFCWLAAGDVCGGRVAPGNPDSVHCLNCSVTTMLTK